MNQYQSSLENGAHRLNIELTNTQLDALLHYHELFIKWNKAYNLTAIRDPQEMIYLHLLDSLAVHPYIKNAQRIIDVGTGPGLPGIVLAIMNPDKDFTLLDSNGKKTRFLFQAKTSLKLDNVTIINDRVEAVQPDEQFDMVISRAFASLADMTHWCQHLPTADGVFLAMKGQFPIEELAEIEQDYRLVNRYDLSVPGVEGERCLLELVAR